MNLIRTWLLKNSDRYLSKWLILLFDIMIVVFLFFFAYVIRFNFNITQVRASFYLFQVPYIASILIVSFLLFQSYSGIIRHTTISDTIRVLGSLTTSFLIFISITFYVQQTAPNNYLNIPLSVSLIHYLLCCFVLINSRVLIKLIYYQITNPTSQNKNVLIYGAGNLGMVTKHTLSQSNAIFYTVRGFIEDNPAKQNKYLEGIKIYSPLKAFRKKFISNNKIHAVIIAINQIPISRKRKITEICLTLGLEVKVIPPAEDWISGEMNVNNIQNIKIEDLLGRESIVLDKANIIKGIQDQVVLITGAAGSIGSEIVRQVLAYEPAKLILFDQAETPLYDLQIEIIPKIAGKKVEFVIGDVNNKEKLQQLFSLHKPDVVFHAAAYKHVPMMEANPCEALRVNVGGTRNLADLSVEYGVRRFVMISTDKAVNPTSIMGATKRMAEIYTQSLCEQQEKTTFIITRFGNVLGSNGSVIPLFKKQIEAGGPVTVTHPEITRYFMTIPEACQLVLEAAFMGERGEIFVFDMGESVKIIDLADKMIRLAGRIPGQDIKIEITGLRPGEKLYEELLANKENTKPTHHPKIMIGSFQSFDYSRTVNQINGLLNSCENMTHNELILAIKQIVPEYTHNL